MNIASTLLWACVSGIIPAVIGYFIAARSKFLATTNADLQVPKVIYHVRWSHADLASLSESQHTISQENMGSGNKDIFIDSNVFIEEKLRMLSSKPGH